MSKHRPRRGTRKKRLGRRLRRAKQAAEIAYDVRDRAEWCAAYARAQLAVRPVVYRGPLAWVVAWWRGEL